MSWIQVSIRISFFSAWILIHKMEIEHIEYREDNRPPVNATVPSAHAGAVAGLAGPSSGSATIDGRTRPFSTSPFGRPFDGHEQQAFGTAGAAVELSRLDAMKLGSSTPVAYLGKFGGQDDRGEAKAPGGHGLSRI